MKIVGVSKVSVLYIYIYIDKITLQSFDIPTNTLLQGQRLTAGKELVSSVAESDQSTRIFRLKMQKGGTLWRTQCKPQTRLHILIGLLGQVEKAIMFHCVLMMMAISTCSIPIRT